MVVRFLVQELRATRQGATQALRAQPLSLREREPLLHDERPVHHNEGKPAGHSGDPAEAGTRAACCQPDAVLGAQASKGEQGMSAGP